MVLWWPIEKMLFILFYFIFYISYMLLALEETAGYISQSNKQEGQITCHSHTYLLHGAESFLSS